MIDIGRIKANPAQVTPITFIMNANAAALITCGIISTNRPAGRPTTIMMARMQKMKAFVSRNFQRPTMKVVSSLSTFLVKIKAAMNPKTKKGEMQEKSIDFCNYSDVIENEHLLFILSTLVVLTGRCSRFIWQMTIGTIKKMTHKATVMIPVINLSFWFKSSLYVSQRNSCSQNRQMTRKDSPMIEPYTTWSKLCAPKYMREITTSTAINPQTNKYSLCFPVPKKSLRRGSYMANAMKECPLGLPKSVGQNHSRMLMLVLNQKGRDSWKACLSTTIKQRPIMRQVR